MERIEYSIVTRAERELAWQVFSNWRAWRRFSDIYGDIRWLKGAPWKPGSRLRIELLYPVPAVVDHVITVCSPPEFVAWIDHALGNTMEQWVTFHQAPDGGTRVHTWADITGSTSVVDGHNVADFVGSFMKQWYDRFSNECDLLAEQADPV